MKNSNAKILPLFKKQLKHFFKKYPQEKQLINDFINNLNPIQAERMQGFGLLQVYKTKIALKKYNISKSKGLRIIFLHFENIIFPFAIYQHSEFSGYDAEKKYIYEKIQVLLEYLK